MEKLDVNDSRNFVIFEFSSGLLEIFLLKKGENIIGSNKDKCNIIIESDDIDDIHLVLNNINDVELTIESVCSSEGKFVLQERITSGTKILLRKNITYELTCDKFFYISKYIRMCLIVHNAYYFGEQKLIHDHSLAFQHLLKNYDQLKKEYYCFLDRISHQNINVAKISEYITYETDSYTSEDKYLQQRKYDNKFDLKNKNSNNLISIYDSDNNKDSELNTRNTNKKKVKNLKVIKEPNNLRITKNKSKSKSNNSRSRSRSISNNKSPSISNSLTNSNHNGNKISFRDNTEMTPVEEYARIFRNTNNKQKKDIFLFECNIGGNSLKDLNFEITNQLGEKKGFDILILDNDKPYISSNIPVLFCLAKVIPIVSKKYLKDCGAKKQILNVENYIIKDSSANTKYKVSILDIYKFYNETGGCKIFSGYSFYVNTKILDKNELKFLIEAGKGVVLSTLPGQLQSEDEKERDYDKDKDKRLKSKSQKKSSSNEKFNSLLQLVIVTKRLEDLNDKSYDNIPKVTSEDIKTSILRREFKVYTN